ncbi:MAG: nucleoid-associated protein [Bacteroidia bacterium]|nr:nucleoid-associated protein [Bacteroidia bacterium]
MLIEFSPTIISGLAIHKVGSKTEEEGVRISRELFPLEDEDLVLILRNWFLDPFQPNEFHRFFHSADLSLNEMFSFCGNIFEDPSSFLTQSVHIVNHLYESSNHPNIKRGEVCVAFFDNIIINDEMVEAVGIFKSENKDVFLHFDDDSFKVDAVEGVPTRKLDKGCLIFNTEEGDGYRVLSVDRASGEAARFWLDDFLKVERIQDGGFYTNSYLDLCRQFVKKVVAPQEDKKEQIEILNKSIEYFSANEKFDVEEFTEQVIEKEEYKETFKSFKQSYEEERAIEPQDNFDISAPEVAKMKRKFKNLIQLDTNIEIRLKSDDQNMGINRFVERGFDEEKGMHYYKVFFHKEK